MQEASWEQYPVMPLLFMRTLVSQTPCSIHRNSAPQQAIPASQASHSMAIHSSALESSTTTAGCTRIPDIHKQQQGTIKEETVSLWASQVLVRCRESLCTAMGVALLAPAFSACQEDPWQLAFWSRSHHHPRCRLSQRARMSPLLRRRHQILRPELYMPTVPCPK